MIEHIKNGLTEAQQVLDQFVNDQSKLQSVAAAAHLLVTAFRSNGRAFSCGNGGSMCDAMHFAEELTGRFRHDRPGLPQLQSATPLTSRASRTTTGMKMCSAGTSNLMAVLAMSCLR